MDFFVFIIWLVLAILVGVFATNRGHSGIVFFLIAAVLSPLIGFIIVLVMKSNANVVEFRSIESGDSKKCPHCAELVKSEAKICKHCGNELTSSKQIFKIKTINTPELEKELVNAYTKVRDKDYESRQEVVEKIAKKFDVTPASISVKLVTLGIYVHKVYTPINNGPRKGELVYKIAVRWGVQEEDIETLLRVNKSVIELILDKAQMKINASTKDWEVSDHDSSKDALIQEIAENWRIDPKEIDTLAKADKRVIRYVLEDSRQFS